MSETIVVIGAGGHAKVVIATLDASGRRILGVFDDDPSKWRNQLLGVDIAGAIELADSEPGRHGLIAIGDNRLRRKLAEGLALRWTTAIHPTAIVHPSAKIGRGTVVFAGAIIQPDVEIGEHVIVNTGVIVEHDCKIGDFAHVAPGVRMAGGVRVGQGAFLGVGSVVIPGVEIGAWSLVGAGGVVLRDVDESSVVVGVPARPRAREDRPSSSMQGEDHSA